MYYELICDIFYKICLLISTIIGYSIITPIMIILFFCITFYFLFIVNLFLYIIYILLFYIDENYIKKYFVLLKKINEILLTISAYAWLLIGKFFHRYSIVDYEKIPQDKPVLIIYYHGSLPIDIYFILSYIYLYKNKKLTYNIVDNFLFKIPLISNILIFLNSLSGTVDNCSKILNNKDNNILCLSPGGVFESQFSTSKCELLWKKRLGFAKIIQNTNPVVIPLFTTGLRESFISFCFCKKFMMYIYEKTKLPCVPIYGGFPYKLTTYIGDPIDCSNKSIMEIKETVEEKLNELIYEKNKIYYNSK